MEVGWWVSVSWVRPHPPCLASAALEGWAGQGKLVAGPLPCATSKIEINDSLEILKKLERRGREKSLLTVNFEVGRKTVIFLNVRFSIPWMSWPRGGQFCSLNELVCNSCKWKNQRGVSDGGALTPRRGSRGVQKVHPTESGSPCWAACGAVCAEPGLWLQAYLKSNPGCIFSTSEILSY